MDGLAVAVAEGRGVGEAVAVGITVEVSVTVAVALLGGRWSAASASVGVAGSGCRQDALSKKSNAGNNSPQSLDRLIYARARLN
jgi:hypothetical protein